LLPSDAYLDDGTSVPLEPTEPFVGGAFSDGDKEVLGSTKRGFERSRLRAPNVGEVDVDTVEQIGRGSWCDMEEKLLSDPSPFCPLPRATPRRTRNLEAVSSEVIPVGAFPQPRSLHGYTNSSRFPEPQRTSSSRFPEPQRKSRECENHDKSRLESFSDSELNWTNEMREGCKGIVIYSKSPEPHSTPPAKPVATSSKASSRKSLPGHGLSKGSEKKGNAFWRKGGRIRTYGF